MPIIGKKKAAPQTTTPSQHCPTEALPACTASTTVQEATQNEIVAEPLVHPSKQYDECPKIKEMKAFCYNCKEEVAGSKVLGHLFFGKLKCSNCKYFISICSDFQKDYPSTKKCLSLETKHCLVQWNDSVWSFLLYSACREVTIAKYCKSTNSPYFSNEVTKNLLSYVEKLNPLKDVQPWNAVLKNPLIQKNLQERGAAQHQAQASENYNLNEYIIRLNSGSQSENTRRPRSIPAEKTNLKALQGTPSSFANPDSIDKPTVGAKAATGKKENNKEITGSGAQTVQESEHQKATQIQQNRINIASLQNTSSSESKVPAACTVKGVQKTKVGEVIVRISSADPALMQQDKRNIASPQKAESSKSTSTLHVIKVAAGSTSLGNLTGHTTQEQMSQETRLLQLSVQSPQKSQQLQSPTQSFRSSPRKLCSMNPSDMRAQQDKAECASKDNTKSSRETKQDSQSTNQKTSNLPKGKRKRSPKRKNWFSEFIPTKVLSSGHYLVVLYPKENCPDECPTCYCSFNPKMCTVNLSTCVMNLVCPECHLAVYMVPKMVYERKLDASKRRARRL